MAGRLISRDALERIIQRAAELQAGERDIGEGLTEAEVLALGHDVGIPARHLRQALLEEQTRVAAGPPAGALGWLAGPRALGAHRVVPGERVAVERALARWLEDEELLQVRRRFPDRTTWEPKAGAFATIRRALGSGGRTYALGRASEVAGQVTQLEPGFCHVQLAADVAPQRRSRLGGAAVLAALGAVGSGALAGTGVLTATAGLALLVPLPLLALGGAALATARAHRRENEKIQTGLEQVLDRLEHGEIRPEHRLPGARVNPLGRLADEIRKTLQA